MPGFEYAKGLSGISDPLRDMQMQNGVTITRGDALEYVNGKVVGVNAKTDKARYVAEETYTCGATEIKKIKVKSTAKGLAVFKVGLTPTLNGVACQSNASTTTVKAALTGTDSDMVGGVVYIPELNQQRFITANTYSGGVVTITVAEPFTTAPTVGHTVRATAFGPGHEAVQFSGTGSANLSNVQGEAVSGNISIFDVDLSKKTAYVSFNP